MKKVILGAAVFAVLAVGVGGTAEAAWLRPTNGTNYTNVNGQNFNVIYVAPKATSTSVATP